MTDETTSILPPAGAPFDLDETLRLAAAAADDLRSAADADAAAEAVLRWDRAMADQQTWSASQSIRFRQKTSDGPAREAKDRLDRAAPDLAETRRVFLAAIAATPDAIRAGLEERFGGTVLDRWGCELRSFDPSVGDDLSEEQRLQSASTALTGGARVEFQGEERTLPAVGAFLTSPDRAVRREAAEARWGWFADHREELDGQFESLVQVRDRIARDLGRPTFVELAYDRMRRTDYGPDDVAAFREAIEEHVVPLATRVRERQASKLGLDRLRMHDELVHDAEPSPAPMGPDAWLADRAAEMFAGVDATAGTRIGALYDEMRAGGLLDLSAREGKGPGGFCAYLPSLGVPFIFANFNGTAGDVRVFTHEMGHAYQGWCSDAALELGDQRRCTSETAEIHSMSLEFLTWPSMDLFFGEAADRFRAQHLAQQIAFLPYGCAIDHFQHEVYARPSMSPAERHGVWASLESRYLPWRDWDGLPHGSDGAAWQAQLHVYQYPFYYIDYVLAETVALQMLDLSRRDPDRAWRTYQSLCDLGGSRGFRTLVKDAGLGDPFDPAVVARVAEGAAATLDGLPYA